MTLIGYFTNIAFNRREETIMCSENNSLYYFLHLFIYFPMDHKHCDQDSSTGKMKGLGEIVAEYCVL
jgi:hypothetical protein